MTTTSHHRFRSDFLRRLVAEGEAEGKARGKTQGKAEALITILESRGIEVPEDLRAKITGCADLTRLEQCIQRAAVAERVTDLGDTLID